MATSWNYGGRIGLASVIFFTRKLCDIYMPKAAFIIGFVDASDALTDTQKTTLKNWLSGAAAACEILQILTVRYEP